jgi:hypothetical protein
MVLFGPTIAHCKIGGYHQYYREHVEPLHMIDILHVINENYYSCNKTPIYRGKEYYYVWSRSLTSITVRQVNGARSEVYPWRMRTKPTSTAATTTKKNDLPLFYLKYALNYI